MKLRFLNHFLFKMILAKGLLLQSQIVCAQSFLFPGASSTFESGLSQTNTRGAAASVNNPANILVTKRWELYSDLNLVTVDYTYVRSGYEPAKIHISAPPVNFGASFKPKPDFALGLFFTPRPALSSTKVSKVPFTIAGTVLPVDIDLKSTSFITGFGLAFKPKPTLSLGLSAVETAEDTQLVVRNEGTTDDKNALVGMRYRGDFVQFMLGFRAIVQRNIVLAGSYKTAVEKSYDGTQVIKGDQDNNVRKKGYSPSVVALGGEYRIGAPSVFGEFRYESWSGGRSSYGSGLPGSTTDTDLNNLIIIIFGGRYRPSNAHSFSGSFGNYPHNVGLGATQDSITNGSNLSGVQFGDFDALDRKVYSGSYRYSAKGFDLTTGISYLTGDRSVPEEYPNPGAYSLTVMTVGIGGSIFF